MFHAVTTLEKKPPWSFFLPQGGFSPPYVTSRQMIRALFSYFIYIGFWGKNVNGANRQYPPWQVDEEGLRIHRQLTLTAEDRMFFKTIPQLILRTVAKQGDPVFYRKSPWQKLQITWAYYMGWAKVSYSRKWKGDQKYAYRWIFFLWGSGHIYSFRFPTIIFVYKLRSEAVDLIHSTLPAGSNWCLDPYSFLATGLKDNDDLSAGPQAQWSVS